MAELLPQLDERRKRAQGGSNPLCLPHHSQDTSQSVLCGTLFSVSCLEKRPRDHWSAAKTIPPNPLLEISEWT